MKKILPIILVIFLFSACSTQTLTPTIKLTATSAPSLIILPTRSFTQTPTPAEQAIPPTSTSAPTEEFASARVSSIDGMPQVHIPAGTFHMGGFDVRAAPDEFPSREVTLDAYWMDQLEVTNAMYQLCVGAGACRPPQNFGSSRRNGYYTDPEFKDYPVVYVTWGQAKAYCEWAGRRLPTEAEWERAARGDDMRTFPWGEDKPDHRFANFNFIIRDTSRVGSYPLGASPFGILDMAGNVAEWTNDFYNPGYYSNADSINPSGPPTSSNLFRVVRGGSLGDAEVNIRVSKRSSVLGSDLRSLIDSPAYLGNFSPRIGFRCVQNDQ